MMPLSGKDGRDCDHPKNTGKDEVLSASGGAGLCGGRDRDGGQRNCGESDPAGKG